MKNSGGCNTICLFCRFSQISAADDHSRADVSSSPQPSAPTRSSPPPAYQPHKDFYSTYGNNGTMDSNTRVPVAASNDLNRNSNTFRT
ncbi:hypothetical protein EB796_010992 [Bugula neritina]|uniref:Uncharacterized protein n=1 Tax=Bugula neritina TaxID=10212 RepID=A0A7J7JXM1_BUGNE|nr:hypothetical protein EB796_010992 [Bugula neritina]